MRPSGTARRVAPFLSIALLSSLTSSCSTPTQVAQFRTPPGFSRVVPLAQDVPVITARLRALGDTGATVVVKGETVVVEGGGALPAPRSFFVRYGHLTLRPVLCGAPELIPSSTSPAGASIASLPSCGAAYRTTTDNLGVAPNPHSAEGFNVKSVPPDPAFGAIPSNIADGADTDSPTLLLPAVANASRYPRLVVGPAQLENPKFRSVDARFDPSSMLWLVEARLSSSDARRWDDTARADFHRYVAADLDGVVLSAPLIQPTQSSFASFDGMFQITSKLTRATAEQLAALLVSGPLPAPLVPA